MVKLSDAYTLSKLGNTKEEALIYLKYWETCDSHPCEGWVASMEELFDDLKIVTERLYILNVFGMETERAIILMFSI